MAYKPLHTTNKGWKIAGYKQDGLLAIVHYLRASVFIPHHRVTELTRLCQIQIF
jgi:hypothetical protein